MIFAAIEWLYAVAVLAVMLVTIYIGLWLSIAWHELGHIVGALLARCRIFEVSIGTEKRSPRWIGATRCYLSPYPNGGYVISLAPTLAWYRLRQFIVLAMGPLFSLSYLAFLICQINSTGPVYGKLDLYFNVLLICIILELRILFNLIPSRVKMARIDTGNDTLQIWWLFTKPLPEAGAYFRQYAFVEATYAAEQGRQQVSAHWVRKLTETPADALPLKEQQALAGYFIGLELWEPARRIAERILHDTSIAKGEHTRYEAADTFASVVLYGCDIEAMPQAIELLQTFIAEFPDVITLHGTLGGLMFETGRFDEAETTLKKVIAKSSAPIDHGISSAYLARIAAKRGAHDEARTLAVTAEKYAGHMSIVKRIITELRESQTQA